MKSFKEVKEAVITSVKEYNPCKDDFKRVLESKNKKELLSILKDNAYWCFQETKSITIEILDMFGEKTCNELGIYYKGVEEKINNKKDLLFLGSFKCKMLNNSTVTEMLNNSTVTKMFGNSTVTEMFGNSTVAKMFGNSTVTEMWGNSTVTEMWGNSTVTMPDSYFSSDIKNIKSQNDNSQVIDLNNNKIYIVKNKFEIVEL